MDTLLPHYERELSILRQLCREFAAKHPMLAGELMLVGEVCGDPHIERLIQVIALLNSRIAKLLADDYLQFTQALLGVLYPHYLRAIPAYSIAHFDFGSVKGNLITGVSMIPRGTELRGIHQAAQSCKYRTAYPVAVAPLTIAKARFDPYFQAPSSIQQATGATSGLVIEVAGTSATAGLDQVGIEKVRVYINGEPSFRAALRDALFMRTLHAHVEIDANGHWLRLDKIPITAVGFADDDALLPFAPSEHPVYRLLTEFFSYPDKFNFFDIDLAALLSRRAAPCQRLTLHLALSEVRADSNMARLLKSLSADNLLLGCTPVINLFKMAAVPIKLTQEISEYPLLPDERPVSAYDIHSVDSVQLLRPSAQGSATTEFTPYYCLRHGPRAGKKVHYYLTRRDETLADVSPGHEYSMAFVDGDFSPFDTEPGTASIKLTCTNRALPSLLPYGARDGDLAIEGGSSNWPIRLLSRPTAPYRLTSANGAHWGLISHLSLNHRSLSSDGLDGFVAMLQLYAPPASAVSQRQIDGIVDLGHRPASAWLRDRHGAAYLNGVEVRVTLDEDAYAGSGIHIFAQLLDHFLGLYVHLNSFTQLIVLSQSTGKELLRCPPRNGTLSLV